MTTPTPGTDVVRPAMTQRDILLADCQLLAGGSLVPATYRNNPANIFIAASLGARMGLDPVESLYRIHVIEGRPTAAAELIASNVRKAGHRLRVRGDDQSCTAVIIRSDDPDYEWSATFTLDDAQRAGLLRPKSNWEKYPKAMLQWRAITACARLACSEALYGVMYTQDEIEDGAAPVDATVTSVPPAHDANARLRAHMGISPEEPPAPVHREEGGDEGQGPGHIPPADDDVSDADIVDETTGEITTPQPDTRRVTAGQLTKMWQAFERVGYNITQKDNEGTSIVLTCIRNVTGNKNLSESKNLTRHEWAEVMQHLDVISQQQAPVQEAHA